MSKRMKTVVGVVATPFIVIIGDLVFVDPVVGMSTRILFAIVAVTLFWLGIAAWKGQGRKGGQ